MKPNSEGGCVLGGEVLEGDDWEGTGVDAEVIEGDDWACTGVNAKGIEGDCHGSDISSLYM